MNVMKLCITRICTMSLVLLAAFPLPDSFALEENKPTNPLQHTLIVSDKPVNTIVSHSPGKIILGVKESSNRIHTIELQPNLELNELVLGYINLTMSDYPPSFSADLQPSEFKVDQLFDSGVENKKAGTGGLVNLNHENFFWAAGSEGNQNIVLQYTGNEIGAPASNMYVTIHYTVKRIDEIPLV
jgi:hypothetical protein